jgi:hypothetical protein
MEPTPKKKKKMLDFAEVWNYNNNTGENNA